MKILIIGQSGFLGSSIINYAGRIHPSIEFPIFKREDFFNSVELDKQIKNCDVIILLSAICRGLSDDDIYNLNISYVDKLIDALDRVNKSRKIVFPSSVQEEDPSGYGRSKKDGRKKLAEWAISNNSQFLGLILPNIFGANAKVNYASFIATFCHYVHIGKAPTIIVDNCIKLIYVDHFVSELMYLLLNDINSEKLVLDKTYNYKVSEVLQKLYYFKQCKDNKQLVKYNSTFDIFLHKTFLNYEPNEYKK
jgi:UDP-2-acetamido-2,6-beta-L-arabino-hexul-4-ose reductase